MDHADDPTTSAWGDYDTWISRAAMVERRMVRKKPSHSASPLRCRDPNGQASSVHIILRNRVLRNRKSRASAGGGSAYFWAPDSQLASLQ
jgi:hypothetical protein